jgi:hypothetical protein
MDTLSEQMDRVLSPIKFRIKDLSSKDDLDSIAAGQFSGGLEKAVSEYDREDALRFAATLGITDTFRGVKQLAGFDKVDMAVDQKILNKLMENPEWGSDIKLTYFGSLLLDPIGWLTPASKVAQLARAGYKFTQWQKARKLAISGATWGTIGGFTGYVDHDSSNRLFNTMAGAAGGTVLAPALGIPAGILGKFIASKTPKQLTDDPQGVIKQLTGMDTSGLTNSVKSFYSKFFQPAGQKYEALKRKYVYKPIILDNPIASVGAAGGAFGGNYVFGDDIDKYINRLEDEGDMDSGPWRSALKLTLMVGAGALTFGALKKGKIGGKSAQDFIGRRVIDNYKLSGDFIKLKEGAYVDFNDISYQFTEIAERAKKLSDNEKKVLYYFLDGQIDNLSGLSKEARELGPKARKIIKETGQMMVDAGMLKPSTFLANIDSYIHRTYLDNIKPEFLRKAGLQVDEKLKIQNDNGRLGLFGVELMMRGHPVRVNIKQQGAKGKIAQLEKDGYEKFGEVINGMQIYRRQLTKAERKAKGEIEDAAYAIKASSELMLNDLAVYKFYSDINSKFGHITREELDRLNKIIKSTDPKVTPDQKAFAKKQYDTHKNSGRKVYDDLSPEEKVGLVQLSPDRLPKTGLYRYGDLAGKYVPKDMADDIQVQRAFSQGESWLGKIYNNKYFQRYRRMNSVWKRTKTSWNPTVHSNNIISNFFLLDSHNVPVSTFVEHGFKVYTKSGQESLNKLDLGFGESNTYEDLVRLGVFDASLARTELRIGQADWKAEYAKEFLRLKTKMKTRTDDPVKDTEDILEMSTNIAGRSYQKYVDWLNKTKIGEGVIGKKIAGKEAIKNPLKWADKGLTDLYQREDQMFRVALYIDRLEKGAATLDKAVFLRKGSAEYMSAVEQIKRVAAKEARKGFIDYNIQAPFINLLRDTGLPFFSYTYRVIPLLAKTATLQPSKFAKWAAIGYAFDYAGRERSKQETEYERALMDERRLSRWFGLPFMPPTFLKLGDIARGTEQFAQKRFDYALGWGLDRDEQGNKLPQTSNYLDSTRWISGGDVLGQTTPDQGGMIAGLPAPFQPSFGLAGEFVFTLVFGLDPFTMKKAPEDVSNQALFLSRLVPNNPLFGFSGLQKLFGSEERNDFYDSWSHKKIMNALDKRPDSSAYSPDLPVLMAVAQTIGIKIWPIDKQKLNAIRTLKYETEIKELEKLINTRRKEITKYYGTDLYDEKEKKLEIYAEEILEKIEDIMINTRVVNAKKFKRRKRRFGEVPLDVVESLGESLAEGGKEFIQNPLKGLGL